jgi:CO dehydrogenase nickel-insertion accessory protein CooC1
MKTIVTMGRGGTGKTSFVALMAKYFIENGEKPLLLVDADPDQNLGEMVGVDLKEEGKKTISELLVETFLEQGGTTVGMFHQQKELKAEFGLMACMKANSSILSPLEQNGLRDAIAFQTPP